MRTRWKGRAVRAGAGAGVVLLALLAVRPAAAQIYLQEELVSPYVPLANIVGITAVTAFDFTGRDEGTADLALPFTFSYLGQPFDQVTIGVNGFAAFGSSPGYTNEPIGDASTPNNIIAAWWDDLIIPAATGNSDFGLLGTAPDRVFIVEVRNVEHYGFDDTAEIDWQLWLHESGRFEVRYRGAPAESYSATAGWEGADGTPFGAFRPCSESSPYCDATDYASMVDRAFGVFPAEGPELSGEVGIFPRGALPGQAVNGEVTLRNLGTEDTGPVVSTLFLSIDEQLDPTDVPVGTVEVPALLALDVPVGVTATVTVPPMLAPDDYYLILEVDSPDDVVEVSEDNNNVVGPFRFATAYDLAATSISAANGGNPGDTVTFSLLVDNVGVVYAGNVDFEVRASTDGILDGTDPIVGGGSLSLTGQASESFDVDLVLPSLLPAEYYAVLIVDPNAALTQLPNLNDVAVAVDTFPSGPSLRPVDMLAPAGANPGDAVTIAVTIENTGVPFSGPVALRFAASPDRVNDVNDPLMGQATVTLDGQASEVAPATFTLPALPIGIYYPIVTVDPADAISEIVEFDNILVDDVPFRTGPDLALVSVASPVRGTPGQPLEVTTIVGSLGASYTGAVAYSLYLSDDRSFDGADVQIGAYSLIFDGETELIDVRNPTFPAGLPNTEHYLIAVVDPGAQIVEADETNNAATSLDAVQSGAELRVDYPIAFAPASVTTGEELVVDFTVLNEGTAFSGALPYQVLFSPGGSFNQGRFTPTGNEIVVYSGQVFMDGEASLAVTSTVTVGPSIPIDDWRVMVLLDPDNVIPEDDEDNNWGTVFTDVEMTGPNLVVAIATGPDQAFIGLPYPVNVAIENADEEPAVDVRFGIYHSPTGVLRPPEGELLVSNPITIAPGERFAVTEEVVFGTLTSTFTVVGVIVDPLNAIPETVEADNTTLLPISVEVLPPVPDLVATIVETPTAAAAGEDFQITRILLNQGVADAPAFDYAYFLSTGSIGEDFRVNGFSSSLAVSQEDYGIDVVSIPADVPAGAYYFGVRMDPDAEVPEASESNNTAVVGPLYVHAAALRVLTDSLKDARVGVPYEALIAAQGGSTDVAWSVRGGALPAGLSLDPATGIIAGTPTTEETASFTVRASSGSAFADRDLTLRVALPTVPLAVASTWLPLALLGRPYEADLVAVGGQPPYQWRAVGAMPGGLNLGETGRLYGVPTAVGAQQLALVVTDSQGTTAERTLVLDVVHPEQTVLIAQTPLPDAVVGLDYCAPEPIRLLASGGMPGYTWSLLGAGPPGLVLEVDGALCGVPLEAGEFAFTVRARDQAGAIDTSMFVLRVRSAASLAVTTSALPDGQVGVAYEATLEATGTDLSWSLVDGALPEGLNLEDGGRIVGTPVREASVAFAVQVVDPRQQVAVQPLSIRVGTPAEEEGGCGCRAAEAPSGKGARPPVWLVLLAGLLILRRQRKRDSH